MAEVPEHLLKRSAERRKALGLPVPGEEGGDAPAADAPAPDAPAEDVAAPAAEAPAAAAASDDAGRGRRRPRVAPRSPRTCSSGRSGARPRPPAATPVHAATVGAGAAAATATIAPPTAGVTGPGGHTQRLLTVVKSGSIQQTKAEAQDKVHVWPHLLVVELASILILLAAVTIFSAVVRAPLLVARRLQQDAEPVEGAVVLPRPPGAAHDVPPDGRGRDDPRRRTRVWSRSRPTSTRTRRTSRTTASSRSRCSRSSSCCGPCS